MFMDPPISQPQHQGDMLMGNINAASSHNSGLEEMLICSPKMSHHKQQQHDNNNINANAGSKGTTGNNSKPQPEQALKCPRCESTNTKFCYYNNYSLSQPRYFCKSCRRYWTQGGTLRNVPVGGGCRKANKRPSSSSSSSSKRPTNLSHADPPQFSAEATSILNPSLLMNGSLAMDLDLSHFTTTNGIFPLQNHKTFDHHHHHPDRDLSFLGTTLGLHGMINNNSTTTSSSPVNFPGFFDTIRSGLFSEPQHQKSSFHNFHGEFPGPCEEMGTILKRDMMMSDHSEGENRILWGFPWNGNIADEGDSARSGGSWNGMNSAAANWQGLINSPLMY